MLTSGKVAVWGRKGRREVAVTEKMPLSGKAMVVMVVLGKEG